VHSRAAPSGIEVLEAIVFAREELKCIDESIEAALLEHDPSRRLGKPEY